MGPFDTRGVGISPARPSARTMGGTHWKRVRETYARSRAKHAHAHAGRVAVMAASRTLKRARARALSSQRLTAASGRGIMELQSGHAALATIGTIMKKIIEKHDAHVTAYYKQQNSRVCSKKYRARYVASTSASGKPSLTCGDDLAFLLEGMEPSQVCRIADYAKGLEFGTHLAKYAKLNNGMQRMNSRNVIKGAINRTQK